MEFTHEANPVRVNARKIVDQVIPGQYILEDETIYNPQDGMLSRYVPVIGDYLVTQEDGYEYFNPKEVFERKYRSL
jgi:hypothetical protein